MPFVILFLIVGILVKSPNKIITKTIHHETCVWQKKIFFFLKKISTFRDLPHSWSNNDVYIQMSEKKHKIIDWHKKEFVKMFKMSEMEIDTVEWWAIKWDEI